VLPPLLPAQDHVQGPVPETDDAVPALHRPDVGALTRSAPFEEPQAPLTPALPGAEDRDQALPVQIHQPLT